MPRGPFDDLAKSFGVPELASTYAAEDFMAQRKRLREARARWIEENECPTALTIEHTDKDGKVIGQSTVAGPFQIGKRRYDENIPAGTAPGATGFKPSFLPLPEQGSTVEDLDKIDQVIQEAETFMAPGIYRESPHPEIKEGEDYGEYYARVAGEYERQTGENAVRRPVPDSDSVWGTTPGDSSDGGAALTAGPGASGEVGANDGGGGPSAAHDSGVSVERGSPSRHDDAGDDASGRPGTAGTDSASGSTPAGEE
jgi:hypothetical protein